MIPKLTPDQYEAIIQAVEYFDDHSDCEIDYDGKYCPNKEMQLAELFSHAFFHLLQENERQLKELTK